jgi:diguanylate cyclase (GGDEF)-like protein
MVLLYGFQHINSYLLLLYHAAISVVGAEMFQHDRRLGQWYLVALFLPLAAVQLAFPGPQSWGALCGFSFYIISLSVRLRRLCAIYASRLAETRDLEASVQPDSLTGLFNRAAMQNHMDRELKGAADTGRRVALLFNLKTAVDLSGRPQALESIEFATASHFTNLATTAVSVTACSHKTLPESESSTAVFRFIDLDGFKATSDTCSHRTGDLFLCEIADRLNRFAGSGLRVARLGGDEFTLLVTDVKLTISRPALLAFAESVLAAVCVPGSIEGRMCAVTASIGVGMFHDDATNAEHLIRAADRAMYEAKRTGKRRICAFGARQLLDLHAPPKVTCPQNSSALMMPSADLRQSPTAGC